MSRRFSPVAVIVAAATGLAAVTLVFAAELPSGFVYLDEVDRSIATEARYATANNFVGRPVDGYELERIILTRRAAEALRRVQSDLARQGYGLKVFDAYRPQRAVNHFVRWTRDSGDTKTKNEYYPEIRKSLLLRRGYIAGRSGHSRGSTVDLTLVVLDSGDEVDMGTPFDFFGTESAHSSRAVTPGHQANRRLLREAMSKRGFDSYHREWWHYTLRNEPFPGQYFDFPVR